MASSASFSMFLGNILCLISDSTKTIRLLALDFYEVMVDEEKSRASNRIGNGPFPY